MRVCVCVSVSVFVSVSASVSVSLCVWGGGGGGAGGGGGHILTCSTPEERCSCGEAGDLEGGTYPWIALGKSLKVWKIINSDQS